MNKITIEKPKNLSSYLEENRTKIDESLVSLRFMKQVDVFLDNNNLTQKNLALDMNISEAYVSQLMTGTKKLNVSFINKFEKKYDLEFKVIIQSNNSKYKVVEVVDSSIEMKFNISNTINKNISWNNISNHSYSLRSSDKLIEIVNK